MSKNVKTQPAMPEVKGQPQTGKGWGSGGLSGRAADLRRAYPTTADLISRAKARTPRFAFDFVQGGVGDDLCLDRNRQALDALQMLPRYGLDVSRVDTSVRLFGQSYALPIGVAPMGLAGLIWPDADEALARGAQRAGIPYVMSTVANTTMERIGELAPDVFWYQLYGVPGNDHALSVKLIHRAKAAGARVLVLTMDVPRRSKRPQDVRNGLSVPFRASLRTAWDVARAPAWAWAMLRSGQPRFKNFDAYLPPGASTGDVAGFVFRNMAGPLTWDAVAKFRDIWSGPLVVKGILHPSDAAQAASLGVDGIVVSNHGGRQFDAAPATIDALPAIAAAVGDRVSVMMDGGIRSGLDMLKTLGRGAVSAFAGRAFLMAYAALGDDGIDHVIRTLDEEFQIALAQSGLGNAADAALSSTTDRR